MAFKKGHIAWNKGKHHSKETIEKCRKANKGKHYSPKTEFKKGQKHSRNWKKAMNKLRGEGNPSWKGGEIITKRGYVYIYKPEHPFAINNHILKHRLIMENYIERYLKPSEIIHHINGNSLDNRVKNLKILTRSEHAKTHPENGMKTRFIKGKMPFGLGFQKGNKINLGKHLSAGTKEKIRQAHIRFHNSKHLTCSLI